MNILWFDLISLSNEDYIINDVDDEYHRDTFQIILSNLSINYKNNHYHPHIRIIENMKKLFDNINQINNSTLKNILLEMKKTLDNFFHDKFE